MATISRLDEHLAVAEREPPTEDGADRWPLVFGVACWFLGAALTWAGIAWLLTR